MPQRCTICAHAQRTAIETAIAANTPLRAIARQHGTTHHALARHRDGCGALVVADARQAADEARQPTVREELARVLARITLLFDACDSYLRDSADPARYDIGPRAEDITVMYSVPLDDEGKVRLKRKDLLSTLVARIEAQPGQDVRVVSTEYKVADPRGLILKTADQLTKQLELLAKLTGELDERPEINILIHPQWIEVRTAVLGALQSHPAALEAVQHALTATG